MSLYICPTCMDYWTPERCPVCRMEHAHKLDCPNRQPIGPRQCSDCARAQADSDDAREHRRQDER